MFALEIAPRFAGSVTYGAVAMTGQNAGRVMMRVQREFSVRWSIAATKLAFAMRATCQSMRQVLLAQRGG